MNHKNGPSYGIFIVLQHYHNGGCGS
jgi:hypothetical protein